MLHRVLLIFAFGLFFACGDKSKNQEEKVPVTRIVNVPLFNSDTAYHFVETVSGVMPRFKTRYPPTTRNNSIKTNYKLLHN